MTSDLRKNLIVANRLALRFLTNFYSSFNFLKGFHFSNNLTDCK